MGAKKESFGEVNVCLGGPMKMFLVTTATQYVCLKTSLGSYLSVKVIGGIIRYPNQKLWHHTSADSDFCAFIPTQRGSFGVEKSPKNRFLEQHSHFTWL